MDINQAAAKLGVDASAPEEEVRAAFRKQARTTHPDAGGSTEAMQELNNAMDAFKERFKEGKSNEPREAQSETYGQQQARSANTNTAEGRKQYNQQYESEGQDRQKEDRYQTRNDWSQTRSSSNAQREYTYDKVYPKLHTDLHGTFSSAFRKSKFIYDDKFYDRIREILEHVGSHNVFDQLTEAMKTMNTNLTEKDLIKSLYMRAEELTNDYFISNNPINKEEEYREEVFNAFKLVLAILEGTESIGELDNELKIIKNQISSTLGQELWGELIEKEDMVSRMDVVRAILSGKRIEEIHAQYKEQKNIREWLKQFRKATMHSVDYRNESYKKAA